MACPSKRVTRYSGSRYSGLQIIKYQIQAYYQFQASIRLDVISWQNGMHLSIGQVKNVFTCPAMKKG